MPAAELAVHGFGEALRTIPAQPVLRIMTTGMAFSALVRAIQATAAFLGAMEAVVMAAAATSTPAHYIERKN